MDKYQQITQHLAGQFSRLTIKRKHQLVVQGEISNAVYFVESGCLRLWSNEDGNDVSVQFFQAGEAVGPFECLFWQKPSTYGLDAVVPTVVQRVDRDVVLSLLDEKPELYRWLIEALLNRLSDYQHRFLSTIKASPQARYQALLKEDPALVELVPQHYIASYLGMTSVSLSRIRGKISKS